MSVSAWAVYITEQKYKILVVENHKFETKCLTFTYKQMVYFYFTFQEVGGGRLFTTEFAFTMIWCWNDIEMTYKDVCIID